MGWFGWRNRIRSAIYTPDDDFLPIEAVETFEKQPLKAKKFHEKADNDSHTLSKKEIVVVIKHF